MNRNAKIVSMKFFCSELNEEIDISYNDIECEIGDKVGISYGKVYDGTASLYFHCKCGELHKVGID